MRMIENDRNSQTDRDPGHFRMAKSGEEMRRLNDQGLCRNPGLNKSGRFPLIPLLLFSLDAGLEADCINPAVRDILGYSRREAASEPGWFMRRVHPDDRDRIRAAINAAFAENSAFVDECRLLAKSGRAVHGLLQVFPSLEGVSGDQPPCLDAVFVDISERVRLETLLVQNEKLKTLGAISAEIVHEIRNPLMAVAGFARRLHKKNPDAPEVEIILAEAARLERLLGRITDYLKPVRFNMAPCSIKALLADGVGLLFPEMEEKGVWCELSIDPDLPRAMADPEILGQVIINLMRNALRELGDSRVIHAGARRSGREAVLEIRYAMTEGAAADPETMFLPFDEGGHSVGLPLCSRMMRNMGGSLSFAENLGEAVFTATLPLDRGERGLDAPRPRAASSERRSFEAEALTFSRKAFEDMFKRMARSASRRGESFSLLLMEHDGGKAISESDPAALAKALGPLLCATQALGRFGSGEIGVLLPGAGPKEAGKIACGIKTGLSRTAPEGFQGVSLGAASCLPGTRASLSEILETAKKALYLSQRDLAENPRVLEVHGSD